MKKCYIEQRRKGISSITIKRRKVNRIGHIWLRNCLLKHIIEGKIKVMQRGGRRRKQLLYDLKETRGYWKFKELGNSLCRAA
jgi:hypothetical protein